jgi:hypothetical protein
VPGWCCDTVQAPPAVYTTKVYLTGSQYPLGEATVNTTAFGVATVTLSEATYNVRRCAIAAHVCGRVVVTLDVHVVLSVCGRR